MPSDDFLVGTLRPSHKFVSSLLLAHTYDIVIDRPYLLFPQLNSTGLLVVDLGQITVQNRLSVDKAGQLTDTIHFLAQGANAAVAEVHFPQLFLSLLICGSSIFHRNGARDNLLPTRPSSQNSTSSSTSNALTANLH